MECQRVHRTECTRECAAPELNRLAIDVTQTSKQVQLTSSQNFANSPSAILSPCQIDPLPIAAALTCPFQFSQLHWRYSAMIGPPSPMPMTSIATPFLHILGITSSKMEATCSLASLWPGTRFFSSSISIGGLTAHCLGSAIHVVCVTAREPPRYHSNWPVLAIRTPGLSVELDCMASMKWRMLPAAMLSWPMVRQAKIPRSCHDSPM